MGAWEDINDKVDVRQKKEDEVKERADNYEVAKRKLAKIVERIEGRIDEQRAFADEPEKIMKEIQELKVSDYCNATNILNDSYSTICCKYGSTCC
jgi:hypothetical protein